MKIRSGSAQGPTRGTSSAAAATTAVLLGFAAASVALAQEQAPDARPAETQRSLEQKRQELDAAQSKEKTLESDVAGLDAERERLNTELLETARLIQKSEGQLTSIEGRLGELEAQEQQLRGSLGTRHGQISKLLSALQRMGRNPPPVLITRREDALKMVRSAMMISSAFPELKEQALALSERLEDLVRVMTDIRQEGDRLRSETARLNEARARLTGLMEAKKLKLVDRQQELASVRAATTEISKSVADLSELIGKLDDTVAAKTGSAPTTRNAAEAPPSQSNHLRRRHPRLQPCSSRWLRRRSLRRPPWSRLSRRPPFRIRLPRPRLLPKRK